jgi:hypothetical protein
MDLFGSKNNNMRRFLHITLCFLFLISSSLCQTRKDKSYYRSLFDKFDEEINDGRGYSDSLNSTGLLAWGESYILRAYEVMYRATSDEAYLKKLVDHTDRLLKNRDDILGLKDEIRDRILPGWHASRYSPGNKPFVWPVHSGMVLYPVANFVELVRKTRSLHKSFGKPADRYLKELEVMASAFSNEWRSDGNQGYYVVPKNIIPPYRIYPLNQQSAMGRVFVVLASVTGKESYKEKAGRLARFFKSSLLCDESLDAYAWTYSPPGLGKYLNVPKDWRVLSGTEDISHAAINVDFACLCYRHGIVFDKQDMIRFANTLTKVVTKGDSLATHVDGTIPSDVKDPRVYTAQVVRWMELTEFDRKVYEIAQKEFEKNEKDAPSKPHSSTDLLGVAFLCKWAER